MVLGHDTCYYPSSTHIESKGSPATLPVAEPPLGLGWPWSPQLQAHGWLLDNLLCI
ncbi:hypothetical protein Pint_09809 [Pistacia integerrima]|uniref:Uncharacterized protein n=2 Tax=Pistacia TaxID=55512 RepID=A0ACC1A9I3_9ROSI|nr:hypothetical protein Pint_09809 [Pistacia integerrima]KAJ0082927.1 hypothetical protein Patl1_09926 [Pistacia atlantica]